VGGATADHKGRLYVAVAASEAPTDICPWADVTNRVSVFDPTGRVTTNGKALKYTVLPCKRVRVYASPNGVVMFVQQYGAQDTLVQLNANLKTVWNAGFDSGTIGEREFLPWLGHDLTVDNNGNVVVLSWYWRDGQKYRGTQVKVLTNGAVKSVFYTDQLDRNVSFRVPMVGLAQGRLYLAAQTCGEYQCGSSSAVRLFAVPVTGLGLDYPRARLFGLPVQVQIARKYVALGDSFSAGLGIEPYKHDGCSRSELAYPELLDQMPNLDLVLTKFVACSGATSEDVIKGKSGEPSQLGVITKDTDVVTLTIGGNDAGFTDFAGECASLEPGVHCNGSVQYAETLDLIQNVVPVNLNRLFGEIRDKIGANTRVLILGYPQLMPPDDGVWPNCLLFSDEEKRAAREVLGDLNYQIHQAVERAGDHFEFVAADGSTSPFNGRHLCNGGSYFFGASLPDKNVSFHPNAQGAQAFADLVGGYLGHS